MKHLSQLTLLLVLFSFPCFGQKVEPFKIDPRTFVKNGIKLSDVAIDIKYYPLDDSIPFENFKYIITPNSIYFAAKRIGILQFNREEGKLIKRIGRIGRGPGEFIFGMDFTVDEKSGNFFILDPGKIIVYSPGGRFLRDLHYNQYITSHSMAGGIEIYNSLLFLPDFIMEGDSKYNWIFLDTLGNLVSSKENSITPFKTHFGKRGDIYRFENKLFYYNYFNDTIFSINNNLIYNCEHLFAQGNYRWSIYKLEANSIQQLTSQTSGLFQPIRMFETKQFIILTYYFQQRAAIALIDKKTKKSFLSLKNDGIPRDDEFTNFSLANDLDGGMPLSDMNYYTENGNEYITTVINPFNLKHYILSTEFKNAVPKYPEKKKELEKLANSLKETDNPILVLVKLEK